MFCRSHKLISILAGVAIAAASYVAVPLVFAASNDVTQPTYGSLHAQLTELQKLLDSIRASHQNGVTTQNNDSISVGSTVEATAPLRVRDEAGLDAVMRGAVTTGTTGTVLAGPISADDLEWYKIKYNVTPAITGWSASKWLTLSLGSPDDKSGVDNSGNTESPRLLSIEKDALTVTIEFSIPQPLIRVGGIVSWGDGSQSAVVVESAGEENNQVHKHVYAKGGTYTITIKSSVGGSISREVTVYGGSADGDIKKSPMFESVTVEDNQVTVSVKITDAIGRGLGILDWDDGEKVGLYDEDVSSAGGFSTVSHRYSANGAYTLKIKSSGGATSSYQIVIEDAEEDEDYSLPSIRTVKVNDLKVTATFLLPDIGVKYFGTIDWGDGARQFVVNEDGGNGGGFSQSDKDTRVRSTMSHTYSKAGAYTISATSILGEKTSKEVEVKEP